MRDLSSPQPILLLTSASRHGNGIGTLFLQTLVEGVPEVPIHWHTERPFWLGQSLVRFGKLGVLLRAASVRLGLWSALRLLLYRHFVLQRRVKQMENWVKVNQACTILLTASSPELIALGSQLAALGHDVRAIVWDAPEYLTANLRLGRAATDRVQRDFAVLMQGARAAAVISEGMKDRYEKMYGVPCLIMRHGTNAVPRTDRTHAKDALRIVFAGSLYSKQEWNAFVAALELADWKLAERDVRLIFIGNFPLTGATRSDRLECLPAVSHERALELMAEMDIGYLPYWFDDGHASIVRSSFPGKMTAYAAAGLAVFHHAPAYSTVNLFLNRYPFGISCESLEPKIILEKLIQLNAWKNCHQVQDARNRAMDEALSDAAMLVAFQRLLMLGESKDHPAKLTCFA